MKEVLSVFMRVQEDWGQTSGGKSEARTNSGTEGNPYHFARFSEEGGTPDCCLRGGVRRRQKEPFKGPETKKELGRARERGGSERAS